MQFCALMGGREKKDRTVLSVSYIRRPIPEYLDANPIRKSARNARPPAKHPKAPHDIDNAMEIEAPSTAGPTTRRPLSTTKRSSGPD